MQLAADSSARILAETVSRQYDAVMKQESRYRATALDQTIRAQGRRQRWLAAQVGVSESHLSRIVSGEREAPESLARRLSEVLTVPLFLVFSLSDDSYLLQPTEAIPA
jgi:transcriptional regulator with XRE-family HTH domain